MEKWKKDRLERLRKEQRKQQEQERPVLHAPRPQPPMWEERPQGSKEEPSERGVAIIDFTV